MLRTIVDLLLGFVARTFLGETNPSTSPLDVDRLFDRLGDTGDRFLARFQNLLLALAAVVGLAALAVVVLAVRIFQLSAGRSLAVPGLFEIDGALLFGAILAVAAAGLGAWIFRDKLGRTEAERPRASAPAPAARVPSPIEEAVAVWILQQVEKDRAESRRPPQTAPAPAPAAPPPLSSSVAEEWKPLHTPEA